jgi:hypothetical protein
MRLVCIIQFSLICLKTENGLTKLKFDSNPSVSLQIEKNKNYAFGFFIVNITKEDNSLKKVFIKLNLSLIFN